MQSDLVDDKNQPKSKKSKLKFGKVRFKNQGDGSKRKNGKQDVPGASVSDVISPRFQSEEKKMEEEEQVEVE